MESSQRGTGWQRPLQSALLALFSLVRRTGVLNGGPGRWLFERSYELYKRLLEAGEIDRLAPYAVPGTTVIDVGANVGFFTSRFARWVGPHGAVIAIEPEAVNFARLKHRMAGEGVAGRVALINGAACEMAGTVLLEINPDHPGDHKLGAGGVPTEGVTLDGLTTGKTVSLIKIDVQGAELRVLAGAGELIRRCRPALFIEIDDTALRRQGGSAAALLDAVLPLGYTAHRVVRKGVSAALGPDELKQLTGPGAGYTDLLFLPVPLP